MLHVALQLQTCIVKERAWSRSPPSVTRGRARTGSTARGALTSLLQLSLKLSMMLLMLLLMILPSLVTGPHARLRTTHRTQENSAAYRKSGKTISDISSIISSSISSKMYRQHQHAAMFVCGGGGEHCEGHVTMCFKLIAGMYRIAGSRGSCAIVRRMVAGKARADELVIP